jgi:tetratricopeptide (TPR) repeat protein
MLRAKKWMRTAAPFLIALFFAAGLTQIVHPQEQDRAALLPSVPDMTQMPGMPDSAREADEKPAPYQNGVKAYLNGKDEDAVSNLEEALRLDVNDEKAKRLLLKVLLRAINSNYERGNYTKARFFIQEARKYFPANPEVKLLYSSMLESSAGNKRKQPAPAAEAPPARQSPPSPRRTAATLSPAAPPPDSPREAGGKAAGPAFKREVRSAAPPLETQGSEKIFSTLYSTIARGNVLYIAAAAVMLLPILALFIFIHMQRKQQKILLDQIESMRKASAELESNRETLHRELEIWKGFGKQVEELAVLRRTKEQSMYQELEKLKAAEERKLMAELAEKRREAERTLKSDLTAQTITITPPSPVQPARADVPVKPVSTREAEQTLAKSQEEKILKILTDIAPPEREAAWDRIAFQAANLYAASPEEAVKFLRTISCDENHLNRASIVGALARIGVPATLDILFELYNDKSVEVRREALKHLTKLQQDATIELDATYREKIAGCLREEKAKGDWVF